jgi:small-conductance mechanosensitive channel
MLKTLDIEKTWDAIVNWCGSVFWTTDTLYQLIALAICFTIAWFTYRLTDKRLEEFIEKMDIPFYVRKVMHNLRRQVLPFTALVTIFFTEIVMAVESFGLSISLLQGISKLLLAWIAIRIALQFVNNRFVRNIFAVSIWAIAALSIFGILDETAAALDAFGLNIGEFRLSPLVVLKAVLSLFAVLYLALFASSFLERRIFKVSGLSRSSQVLMAKGIRITLVVVAILIGVTSAGIDLSLFAVLGGAIGLGIGFGLQKGISNLFSGMLLLMDQSIKPGDVIEMENGTFGWVNNMAARYTELVTRDNKSFLIPNEELITTRVVNWSHGNTLIRLEVKFGVDYKHNPHDIRTMAVEATKDCHERICPDPEPVCHLTEFGDSSLNFVLRFWITDAEEGITNIRGAVMLALWDAFQENNITIPYPHREVYVREAETKTKKAS